MSWLCPGTCLTCLGGIPVRTMPGLHNEFIEPSCLCSFPRWGLWGSERENIIVSGLSPNVLELIKLGLGQGCMVQHLLSVARSLPCTCHLHPGCEPKSLPWFQPPCWASLAGLEQVNHPETWDGSL